MHLAYALFPMLLVQYDLVLGRSLICIFRILNLTPFDFVVDIILYGKGKLGLNFTGLINPFSQVIRLLIVNLTR